MIVAESFLRSLIKIHGKHTVYSDGGTWYPEAYILSLGLEHRLHSSYQKSIVVERTIEYLKDRTEAFDDYYYPCMKAGLCNLRHVHKWFTLCLCTIIALSNPVINLIT